MNVVSKFYAMKMRRTSKKFAGPVGVTDRAWQLTCWVGVEACWHMGTHVKVLTESFLKNTNMTGFRCISNSIFFVIVLGQK